MSAPRKYDQEFRERAVRMYLERLAEPGESKRGARRHVGVLLDLNPETLRNWAEERDRVESGRSPAPRRAQPGAAVGGIGGGSGTSAAGGGAGTRERDPQDLGRVFRPGGARPPIQVIVDYIDCYRARFGVEPVCAVLAGAGIQIAPSSYYARSKARLTEAELDDAYLANALWSLWQDNWGVYGARKLL